jgi:nicotinamide mononucleotide (NMN) deamidase PncC
MSEISQETLVHAIHDAGLRLVIAVTGGGSGAISALLGVGGASRSILAATVPYAEGALSDWLGATPEEFCSSRTARAMAMAAYEKARRYDPQGNCCGIGSTASLASDRPKRGAHRAHLAYQTASTTATCSLELAKGQRTRAEEEQLASTLVLNLIAEAGQLDQRLPVSLRHDEELRTACIVAPQGQQDLLAGRLQALPCGAAQPARQPQAVFPGAFNPLHVGHTRMAEVAGELLGAPVAYEISIANVDKPPLDFIEVHSRLAQFAAGDAVWLTRAPLFVEKAELFPNTTFVVGCDTIERIGQLRYYEGEISVREAAIGQIAAQGCRFLVFGRETAGKFKALGDLAIPPSLAELCQEVPASVFRQDISSTELRRSQREE